MHENNADNHHCFTVAGKDYCYYADKMSCAIGGCRVNNGGCEQECIPLDKVSKTRYVWQLD